MQIKKFVKLKNGKYKLVFDNKEELTVYEDVIFKYDLLLKKSFDNSILDCIAKDNYRGYVNEIAYAYLKKRVRSIKEVRDYLFSKEVPSALIDEVVDDLIKFGYLDDTRCALCYVNDRTLLSNDGPLKIIFALRKMGIDNEIIDKTIVNFDNDLIREKITKYINNMLKSNKTLSSTGLKNKIMLNLVNMGYNKSDILPLLSLVKVDDRGIYEKEYNKLYKKYSRKYSGNELSSIISNKLYQKGLKKTLSD